MSTSNNDSVNTNEQIKNNSRDVVKFYDQLKIFLEKDKFNLFKTKVKFQLDNKIEITNLRIQKLIDLKVKSKTEFDSFLNRRNSLKEKNFKLRQELVKKLELTK
jgi:hypothetical protein